jgi:protocatechuate 3,4-dioxygenase alpha subunit
MTTSTPRLVATPGETIGPFFGFALPFERGNELVAPGHASAIRLHGRVLDGLGAGVPDALLELWQLAPDGSVVQQDGSLHRDGWTFTGWGRAETDADGHYWFTTLPPGSAEEGKPAFFAITLFARGLLNRLFTRAYLPEDTEALAADPLLASLEEERRKTLVCLADDGGYVFDLRLQGDRETVFLRYPRQ